MLFKRIKIPIAMQQLQAVHDAAGRDHGVDGLAHREAKGTQLAKILGGFDGELKTTQVDGMQVESVRFTALNSRSVAQPCKTSVRIKSPMASGTVPNKASSFSACGDEVPRR